MARKTHVGTLPVYQAYSNLQSLPDNAPLFEIDDNGHHVVESKEVFCRVRGAQHGLCGERLHNRANLVEHLKTAHNARASLPLGRSGRARSYAALIAAKKFYTTLMKDVHYPGKRNFEEGWAEIEEELKNLTKGKEMKANKQYHRYASSSEPSSDDGSIRNTGKSTRCGTPNLASLDSVRRRRGILSPDPDDNEGDEILADGLPNDDDEENEARETPEEKTVLHSPTAHISKKQKRVISEPKVKAGEHKVVLIEDDLVESVADAGHPSAVPDAGDNKGNITLIEDESDDEDTKHTVLIISDDEEEADIKPPTGGPHSNGRTTEQGTLLPNTAVEDDMEDIEFEMEKAEIKAEIKQAQLQARLEVVQLKQKMAAMKKRKAEN